MLKDMELINKEIETRNKQALEGGGAKRIEKQHQAGKLTARERIEKFVDPGTFVELDQFVVHRCTDFGMESKRVPGDGVVTGHGEVDGRRVFLFAQDFTVNGGSLGKAHADKICKVMDMAMRMGCPFIAIQDSGGARIQEGVESLAGYGEIFYRNVMASGVVPQISVIMGPCAGGAVYSPALTDFVFMVDSTSYMFITGPDVIKATTFEEITKEGLGGAKTHNTKSGVAHFMRKDDEETLRAVRELLSFLPLSNREQPPRKACSDPVDREDRALDELVPHDSKKVYDIQKLIKTVVDDGDFLEVHKNFARNLVIGFARLAGRPVGIVANQPFQLAGCLDVLASTKGARFIRFLDAFNIPIITFEDVPGFLPGTAQEFSGIIKHGAKMIYAYCEANVPRITVITRKAYGGAYVVMSSKHVGGDINFAYPTAEVAVMGAEGAAGIISRKQIAEAADPKAERRKVVKEYTDRFSNPLKAAELGYVDEVIAPRHTRRKLIEALRMLETKRRDLPPKKHGNIPL